MENLQLEGGVEVRGVWVKLWVDGRRNTVTLEFNAARLAGLPIPQLLPPPVFQYLVQRLLDDLLGHFWPTILIVNKSTGVVDLASHWPKVVKIVRIDLARDFNVSDDAYPGIKTGLEAIVPSHVQSAQRIVSKDGGWTYYAKTKSSGLDRIYDKAIEGKGLAPSGTIRFETQVIRGRRETLGLNVLADVNDETCIAALRARYKASRWGSDIKVGSGLTQVLERFPIEQSRKYLAFLAGASTGYMKLFPDRQVRLLRKELKVLGAKPGEPLEAQFPVWSRLDFDQGFNLPLVPPV